MACGGWRGSALVLLVLAALALAACSREESLPEPPDTTAAPFAEATYPEGEVTREEYATLIGEVDAQLNAAMGALFGSAELDAGLARAAREALDDAQARLEAVTPPPDAAEAHEQYLEGVRAFGPVIDALVKADGDEQAIRQQLESESYQRATRNLEQAHISLRENGYLG